MTGHLRRGRRRPAPISKLFVVTGMVEYPVFYTSSVTAVRVTSTTQDNVMEEAAKRMQRERPWCLLSVSFNSESMHLLFIGLLK